MHLGHRIACAIGARAWQRRADSGAHSGDRRCRLYRPRTLPGARGARPCRPRRHAQAGTAGRRRRVAPARRYRTAHRLVGIISPESTLSSISPLGRIGRPAVAAGEVEVEAAAGAGARRRGGWGKAVRPNELDPGDGRGDAARPRRFAPTTRRAPTIPMAAPSLRSRARCLRRPSGPGSTSSSCARRSSMGRAPKAISGP